jgi:hypothetical protein
MTLTPDKLDELLRLREAGTQGEWAIDGIAIAHLSEPYGYPIDICLMGEPAQYPGDIPVMMQNHEANAALIAAAVNNLPALVAAARERDALRAALADVLMIAEYLKWQDADDGRSATYARARAALEGRHE